jgi:hypothetical protein
MSIMVLFERDPCSTTALLIHAVAVVIAVTRVDAARHSLQLMPVSV